MVKFTSKGWSSWNNKLVGPRVCVCVLLSSSSSSSSSFCVQDVCGKKGKKMCCVRAGTFEILHHLSLSLSFVSCNVPPSNHGRRRITEHPTLPTHQKQNPKTKKKNYTKKKPHQKQIPNRSIFRFFGLHPVPRDFSKEMLKRDVIYDIIIYLSIAPFCLFCFCVLLFSQFSQFSQFLFFFFFCLSLSPSLLSVSYFQCDVVVRSS